MALNIPKMKRAGERLKYIREKLLRLSRAEVHKKYGLSPDTLAAWENGKIEISEKGMKRCVKIFHSEKVIVSTEWILTGEGLAPNFSFDLNRYFKTLKTEALGEETEDSISLVKEIEFFRSLSPNATTCLITSEDMLPFYSLGDYVGGKFRYAKEIKSCIGKDCIVKCKDGATYVRRISKLSGRTGYNLACLNPAWGYNLDPVMFDVKIECAAPIIWHRRQDNKN